MMRKLVSTILCCSIGLVACKPPANAPLEVTDAYAYAPLSSGAPGVAYLTLSNRGTEVIDVRGFKSDCFAQSELHASVLDNGVSEMQAVATIPIAAQSSLSLRPGGLHLMLMRARSDVAAGTRCEFTVIYGQDKSLSVAVTLLDRATYRPAEPVK